MIAYMGSQKLGEVFSSTWRSVEKNGKIVLYVGSMVLEDGGGELKEGTRCDISLMEERDCRIGIIKFKDLEVTQITDAGFTGFSFTATEFEDWKPIGR